LLDGKLVFGTDYTIEYYQVKVTQSGIDIPQAFPRNSWEGERMVDHRYKYFLNTERSRDLPGYIRHYAKFVFLNRVPLYGQIFKVTYDKNIDLYNAVDRINSLYNPTDLMPGKELPLLIDGAEYPGISVQGLMFNQTPNWDNTGTQYDSAPWGDTVSSYAVAKLTRALSLNDYWIDVDSTDGIFPGQTIVPLNTSTQVFQPTTVVESVAGTRVYLTTLDVVDTQIKQIYSTGTAIGSTIIIKTKDSFNTAVQPYDLIWIRGVKSTKGYGIDYINTSSYPILSTSTTSIVSITIAPPDVPGGRQATAHAIQQGFTVTNIVIDQPGMGYSVRPVITFGGTSPASLGSATAYLDPGYNQVVPVLKCTDNYIEVRSIKELSSTSTTLSPNASFRLTSVIRNLTASNKLLDQVVKTFSANTILSAQTFAPFNDAIRAEVTLSTSPSTEILSTSTNTLWYSISNSVDGLNRAVVSVRHANSTTSISGVITARVFGATELEFYDYNHNYNALDSAISGSTINNTTLGYNPEDIIIDGNNFLNAVDSYAPEECVPGYVTDSVGINVFTTAEPSSPMVVSGAFTAGTDGLNRITLSWIPVTPLGFRVQANGNTFDRVINETAFTSSTQYCIFDGTIVVPAQPYNTIVGYSFVTAGANVTVDSTYIGAEVTSLGNTGTISVSSLLEIDDVKSVYVLLNGQEVPASGAPSNIGVYGYVVSPTGSNNNRAMVTVNGLASNLYNLEAWFFDHPFPKFNTFHEQFYNIGSTATSYLTLDRAPGTIEPVSEQVIVEKITSSGRYRMLPPWVSYYKIRNNLMTYDIDPKNNDQGRTYTLDNVKVYLNGIELRPGYDFIVNATTQKITLVNPQVVEGDAIAITPMLDYDYIVSGTNLYLSSAVTTATIKVTSFTDHDNMMIRTERFKGNDTILLSYPVINENYVWVTINSKPLIAGSDYAVLEDLRSVGFSPSVNIKPTDDIVIVVINPPSYENTVLGYRVFKDMFDKNHFSRISEYFSTRLAQPLQYTDDKIFVKDGDHLLQPNPERNLPGVVYIDGERIEYTSKDGNVLSGLRRATLGTGPAKFSDINTKVIDQSIRQNIPTVDYSLIQHIPSSNTTTYTISDVSNTATFSINTSTHAGDGIVLSTLTNAVDQIEVYYGGRQLRKSSLNVHDKSVSYYDSASSTIVYPPEFTMNTPVTVPVVVDVNGGTPPTGSGWVLPETTATMQIQPGWIMKDATGARYTVIYSGHNNLFNGWGVGFATAINIAWPLTFIESTRITLNIAEEITTGTRITIVKKEGALWKGTEVTSLLSSTATQANFLRSRPAQLPDIYFYGGEKVLIENSIALTDENGEPLEGY
jgi:hypothetical protein